MVRMPVRKYPSLNAGMMRTGEETNTLRLGADTLLFVPLTMPRTNEPAI